MTEVEIVPLTEDRIAAIKECRFVFTNLARTIAIGLTTNQSVAMRCPGGVTTVKKSHNPEVVEYDVQMSHPYAIALVAGIQEERKKQ